MGGTVCTSLPPCSSRSKTVAFLGYVGAYNSTATFVHTVIGHLYVFLVLVRGVESYTLKP
jgi:hypothetical protein